MKTLQKRIAAAVLVGMLAFSGAALPDRNYCTAYASASYSNEQTRNYAMQVAGIVNRERAANGLAPLKYSDKLSEAALVRAEEIQSVFSHTRPNGTRCFTAVTEAGISYTSVGENIAYGQRTPEEVMNSWMNSSGHRANILGSYDYIGIGVTYKNGTYYWSQFFAVSKDLSGEVITLGSNSNITATTVPTSKATTAATVPTSKATTAPTSKATTAPTSKATTAPTSRATTAATVPTSKATTAPTSRAATAATTAASSEPGKSCYSGKKAGMLKKLLALLGVK